tara:strand:+ start:293 stop:541 length:249 start_codon:yes stop_codon:yes gene_type:complete
MRSNSPFRQDKCATGWAALEAGYKDKEEYKKEKNEYHCNESTKYKVVLQDSKENRSEAGQTKEAKERGISKGKPLPPAKPKN